MTTTTLPPKQTNPGRDFLRIDDLAKDALVGFNGKDITQFVAITKWSLQKFIEECLAENGVFRKFFEKFATYTANYVVNENLSADARKRDSQLRERFKRHIQVARQYEDMRERPPQIFIQDAGYTYAPSSLGGLSSGFAVGDDLGSQVVSVSDSVEIPIVITCAALDQQITEDLAAFLSCAFGSEAQTFTTRYILKPAPNDKGIYWEVQLPAVHNVSPKRLTSLAEDPKRKIYSFDFTFTVRFENSAYIHYRNDPRYYPTERSLSMIFPDRVRVGTTVPVEFSFLEPAFADVKSSDQRVAVVYKSSEKSTRYLCKAKRLGSFTLIVMSNNKEDDEVLLEKEVQVVTR